MSPYLASPLGTMSPYAHAAAHTRPSSASHPTFCSHPSHTYPPGTGLTPMIPRIFYKESQLGYASHSHRHTAPTPQMLQDPRGTPIAPITRIASTLASTVRITPQIDFASMADASFLTVNKPAPLRTLVGEAMMGFALEVMATDATGAFRFNTQTANVRIAINAKLGDVGSDPLPTDMIKCTFVNKVAKTLDGYLVGGMGKGFFQMSAPVSLVKVIVETPLPDFVVRDAATDTRFKLSPKSLDMASFAVNTFSASTNYFHFTATHELQFMPETQLRALIANHCTRGGLVLDSMEATGKSSESGLTDDTYRCTFHVNAQTFWISGLWQLKKIYFSNGTNNVPLRISQEFCADKGICRDCFLIGLDSRGRPARQVQGATEASYCSCPATKRAGSGLTLADRQRAQSTFREREKKRARESDDAFFD